MSELDVLKRKRDRLAKESNEQLAELDKQIEEMAKKELLGLNSLKEDAIKAVQEYNKAAGSVGSEMALLIGDDTTDDDWGYNSEYLIRGSKNSWWFPSTAQC